MIDIASSCRTCMKDNTTLLDLYETVKIDENCLQLADLLAQCMAIQVSKNDGLPQKLCNDCVRILQETYSFRYRAAKCEEEFKRLLETTVKTEQPEMKIEDDQKHELYETYDDFNYTTEFTKSELGEKDYECSKCNKRYTSEKKFMKHWQMHDNPALTCVSCNKLYHSQSSLDKHVAKHHKDYKCMICELNFGNKTFLIEHMAVHKANLVKTEIDEQENRFKCPKCEMSFVKQRSLAMHMKKHNNKVKNTVFICDICGKVFQKKCPLRRHLLIHSEMRPYRCTKCPKRYARQDQYMHHIYSHNEHKPYTCSYCKKGFTQLCSLKDHIRIHTGETPFLCSECGKGFTNSSNLRQHMMRHTGLKPYACNMCPKTFCTKGQMTSHMTTHTGEHPYKCEECGAAFTKPNSLKKHSLIHLGVRPFACDTCNMRFTCKDHLKRHQRIHTGEKPYRCKFCDRGFAQSNDLVKHIRGHIGQNIYQCTICALRFRLLSELKMHYPVHFGIDNEDSKGIDQKNIPTIKDIKPETHSLEPKISQEHPLSFKPFMDKDLLNLKPNDKNINSIDKDLSLLAQKPIEEFNISEVKGQEENRITITINGCDKNGLVNDIIINIAPEGDK